MGRRVLPVLLVAVAAIADSAGDHSLARTALLFALPFAAVAALVRFGGFLDSRERFSGIQALCSAAIVALIVLSCAVRSSAAHGVPQLAVSSLVAVVGLLAVQGLLIAVPYWRRLGSFSPAKP
jgi:hypothetical protein